MKKKILIAFFVLSIFCLGFPCVSRAQFPFMFRHPLEGKKAPNFTVNSLKASDVIFEELRADQSAILFFWATWCPHCRRQLVDLGKRAEELKEKGIQVILVNLGETKEIVKYFMDRAQIDLDILMDEDGSVAEKYAIMVVPTYFFVDAQGTIRAMKNELPNDVERILGR